MAKSRAEYQKEYRERKKKADPTFLQKERLRVKQYRVPVERLSKKKQDKVRRRNRIYSSKYRDNQKIRNKQGITIACDPEQFSLVSSSDIATNEPRPSTSYTQNSIETRQSASDNRLLLKLQFPARRKTAKKRSKALRKASLKVSQLQKKVSDLTKERSRLKKRIQRMKMTKTVSDKNTPQHPVNNQEERNNLTPKSRTKQDLKLLGLKMSNLPRKIVKKLEMTNAVIAEVNAACKTSKSQKERRVVTNVVSGRILSKYKCLEALRRETGLSRKGRKAVMTKTIAMKGRKRLELHREKMRKHVVDFMERDDISIQMPGKNDAKLHEGEKRQVRILNDYIDNIFTKYRAEFPEKKISKTVFSRFRPKYILLTSFISRSTCLCSRHQNFAMKLKSLRTCGLNISSNPETVSKSFSLDDMTNSLTQLDDSKKIKYEEWRRVSDEGKKRMKIVVIEVDKQTFMDAMIKEYEGFLAHVHRVRAQYAAVRHLKENLKKNHVVINMDFAENYTCGNTDEIQSAYWNAVSVTLHPVVIYYKDEDESLQHKNYIFISDVANHNTAAVFTVLKKLVPEVRNMLPNTETIHYWTDSPSSQYRNRYVFDILKNHKSLLGTEARWNYYESGHGKGPCDGLGGVAKRQASEACKQGKVTIQDARDFYTWAKSNQKNINYLFYSVGEYTHSVKELDERNPKTITGTMKLHAVLPINGKLYTAVTSCYCTQCMNNQPCDHWKFESDGKDAMTDRKTDTETTNTSGNCPDVESYVIVQYDNKVYIGKVVETDLVDKDARITFMERTRGKGTVPLLKWPSKPDEIWVDFNNIICSIEDPLPYGKTRRQFKLTEKDNAIYANL